MIPLHDQIADAVCINLKRRVDRWNAFESRAKVAGFGFVRRFEAIDGSALNLPDKLKTHQGTYGCLHSHAAVYKHALASGYSHVLVVEDDCVFNATFDDVKDYLAITVGNYSWIHLGGSRTCYPQGVSRFDSHSQVATVMNTHAYVIDQELMASYVRSLEITPFPQSELLHADRLILSLCRDRALKISIPLTPFAVQDKGLPSDVQWGLPRVSSGQQ
mgnify:CR=1 FL=1